MLHESGLVRVGHRRCAAKHGIDGSWGYPRTVTAGTAVRFLAALRSVTAAALAIVYLEAAS